jgi:hypothetical protein
MEYGTFIPRLHYKFLLEYGVNPCIAIVKSPIFQRHHQRERLHHGLQVKVGCCRGIKEKQSLFKGIE